ncbi:MAG TPA: hypothetical protein VGP82_19605, partial [Ktedonobacterales bacterium]|nr:hypothetical protein [Ktedonobacterales bacterium]
LESWGEPFWMQLLVPLVAFAAVALGAVLLARVPAGAQLRSNDPRYPLTGVGALPLRELPAARPNRIALGVVGLLLACIALGVLVAMWSGAQEPALLAGVLTAGFAGVLLALDGALVAIQRVPIPAWRWIRMPVQSLRAPRGTPLALAGIAVALWALLILAYAGQEIGAVGLALLLIACVLAAPVTRRISWRQAPQQYPMLPDAPGDGVERESE